MSTDSKISPKISSFAAPTEQDLEVLRGMSQEERDELIRASINEALKQPSRKVTADDIVRRGLKRLGLEHG